MGTFLVAPASGNQYHSGWERRTLLGIQLSVHVNNAFHVVVVIQVCEKRLHTFQSAIVPVLHVSTYDDSGLAVVFHACKGIERNLWVKAGYHLSVILHFITLAERWVGNNNIILLTSLERLGRILLGNLCKTLLAKIVQSRLVKLVDVYLIGRNCEHKHSVTGCRL